MGSLIVLAVLFVLMWFLIILPQQRRVRAHREVVATLQVGDEVMTSGGMYGTITELDDRDVRLEVATGIELRFARDAVLRRTEVLADADPASGDESTDQPQ